MDTDKKLYEIGYLIAPTMTEEESQNFHQTVKNYAQESGGFIDHEGEVARRTLSYPIKKTRDAYFAHFRVLLPPDKTEHLKKFLENKNILRSLVVVTKHIQTPMRIRKEAMLSNVSLETPQQPPVPPHIDEQNLAEIDKKLEEILG